MDRSSHPVLRRRAQIRGLALFLTSAIYQKKTQLYHIIEQYYPEFVDHLAAQGKTLPGYVHREFEEYLKWGCLEHGFLRVRCESCHTSQGVKGQACVIARSQGSGLRNCIIR